MCTWIKMCNFKMEGNAVLYTSLCVLCFDFFHFFYLFKKYFIWGPKDYYNYLAVLKDYF